RGFHVTGVQTCALPISQTGSNNRTPLPAPPVTAAPPPVTGFRGAPPPQPQTPAPAVQWPERPPEIPPVEAGPPPLNWNKPARPRSEERRVGKETTTRSW